MATETLASPAMLGSTTKTKVYKNFIDGEWVESSTGETFENRNPADTRDVVGIFQKSANPTWTPPSKPRKTPLPSGDWFPPPAAPKSSSAPPKCCWSARKNIPAT